MLEKAYGYPVGFSDHTLGTDISIGSNISRSKSVGKTFYPR